MPKENKTTEQHGAHAGTRKGTSEYNDGGNINYQLGNDDYVKNESDYDRNFVEDAFSSGIGSSDEDIGKVAFGNNLEDGEKEDEMLDEEGMESFPASDPPGHRSKSTVDQETHRAG